MSNEQWVQDMLLCILEESSVENKDYMLSYFSMLMQDAIELSLVYLGFYVAFNTVQVISRRVVGRAEETSTYSSLGFCTVNCRPTASNYQLSHLRP